MKKSIYGRSYPLHKSLWLKPLFGLFVRFLAAAWLFAGCSPSPDPQPPVSAPTGASALTVPASTQSAPFPSSTLPPLAQPTSIPSHPQTCLPPGNPAPLVDSSFDIYPHEILSFLNAGGTAKDLDQTLYALGIANLPVPVGVADMTGDGIDDVVVSIYDPGSVLQPPAGVLLVYICDQPGYRLAYQEDTRPNQGAPGIRYLQDMNADGRAELVFSSASCGAHTCFERVQLISWGYGEFSNRLVGETTDLPYPTIYLEPGQDEGIFYLSISGSGIGSVGAGPQRNITRVWAYEPSARQWLVSSTDGEPSIYRIHVLQDANSALKAGDYQAALGLYNRTISDSTLQDWVNPAAEQAWITAFSRFQLVIIYTVQDQEGFASLILDDMSTSYPLESPQHGYLEMTLLFKDGFNSGGMEEGCTAAIEYASKHTELLEQLGSQTFGYGNPSLAPQDICPWTQAQP